MEYCISYFLVENKKFITKYCEKLDQCHGQKDDLFWFSTWMASKSPYFSYAKKFESYWSNKVIPTQLSLWSKICLITRLSKTLLSLVGKSLILKLQYRAELAAFENRPDKIDIFRTFLYSTDPQVKDPFWGDLIPELQKSGLHQLIVLFEPQFSIFHCKKITQARPHYLPYFVFIQPLQIIKFFFQLIKEAFTKTHFSGDFQVNGQDISSLYETNFQEEILRPSTLSTLAFYDCFSNVIQQLSINTFYIPFENNPWEKMLILARKKLSQNFMICGAQHAVIPEDAANYFLSEYESKNQLHPDLILTTGDAPTKILKSYPHYRHIRVESGCALRYSHLQNREIPVDTRKNHDQLRILVPLDGTDDALALFHFVLNFKSQYPKNRDLFIIQPHPNYQLSADNLRLLPLKSEKTDLQLTTQSLSTNLHWADVVLYCGTAVSLEALALGKLVIQYHNPYFNFDPLFQIKEKHPIAHTETELQQVLSHLRTLSEKELFEIQHQGFDYVKSYFFPCTQDSVRRFSNPSL